MNEKEFYLFLLTSVFILSPLVAFTLFYVTAPYGRHASRAWGPGLNAKLGWIIMEIAALLSFDIAFFLGDVEWVGMVFFILWNMHYMYRAIVYPLRLPASAKEMPLLIMLMGFFFNVVNGYLNGRYISGFSGGYSVEWLVSVPFVMGLVLFLTGFFINIRSDNILLHLRRPGEREYKIPSGFLYRYVSCPNYFGEVVEWFGWAILTWSLPGLAFAIFTAANLVPRGYAHHMWYRSTFSGYPQNRKAVVPFLF